LHNILKVIPGVISNKFVCTITSFRYYFYHVHLAGVVDFSNNLIRSDNQKELVRNSTSKNASSIISQKKLKEISHALIPKIEKIEPETKDDKIAIEQGFYSQGQMESIFNNGIESGENHTLSHWYKSHHGPHLLEKGLNLTFDHYETIPPGNYFNCNLLTDEWFKWFLTTPRPKNPYSNPGESKVEETEQYGIENAFLMQTRNSAAYFTTAAPFQQPDEKLITLEVDAPLLVPVYNVCASTTQYPSLNPNPRGPGPSLLDQVISDLLGIKPDTVKASLDGQPLEPCCVIRREPLTIEGIPMDNVFGIPSNRLLRSGTKLNIVHGGFWAFIRPESITSGDHLLEWTVDSVNYRMNAAIRINALV
jgi:hypothetical protein